MKTQLANKWKGATRYALLAVVAVLAAFSSGCGKKSSNNNGVPYYGYGANPGCTNCGSASSLLSSALGEKSQGYVPLRVQIGLEFYGQGMTQGQYPQQPGMPGQYPGQYSDPYAYYQGPVQAQGRMRITQADTHCGIPVGDYTLTTITAGQYSRGIIDGLILQASGPYPLTVRLSNTYITDSNVASVGFDGRQYPDRLQNDIYINNCRYVIE